MLLAIDVGNTQTVIGLYKSGDESHQLLDHWRIATNAVRTSDELALMFSEFLLTAGHDWRADLSGVAISSGVPSVTFELRRMCERYLDIEPVVLGTGVKTGMPVLYDNPKEVGADRIANAVGAFDLYGGPTIVVDFGTATTFDVVSGRGEYLGGAIAPGLGISTEALFQHASKLPRVELLRPRSAIGKTTVHSMQSGLIFGYAGLVDALVRRIIQEMGGEKPAVIATGGIAPLVASETETIEEVDELLTLTGLRILHERNQ